VFMGCPLLRDASTSPDDRGIAGELKNESPWKNGLRNTVWNGVLM
jgi:hypothetical protein